VVEIVFYLAAVRQCEQDNRNEKFRFDVAFDDDRRVRTQRHNKNTMPATKRKYFYKHMVARPIPCVWRRVRLIYYGRT